MMSRIRSAGSKYNIEYSKADDQFKKAFRKLEMKKQAGEEEQFVKGVRVKPKASYGWDDNKKGTICRDKKYEKQNQKYYVFVAWDGDFYVNSQNNQGDKRQKKWWAVNSLDVIEDEKGCSRCNYVASINETWCPNCGTME